MKLFKRIYYPVMAVLVALMLVLGIVDSNVGTMGKKRGSAAIGRINTHINTIAEIPHNSFDSGAQKNVRDYIISALTSGNTIKRVITTKTEDGNTFVEYAKDSNSKLLPSINVQTVTLQESSLKSTNIAPVNKVVNNIIVAVPGSNTLSGNKGKAILVTAHYDSMPLGGASDSVAPAAMIENILNMVSLERPYSNDICFVFTDASREGAYGSLAFMNQFKGFDNIVSRIKLAANFDTKGNKGVLMMYESTKDNLNLIGQYAKINDGAFVSSASNVLYSFAKGYNDFDGFKEGIAALNFANNGGSSDYGTANDTIANLSDSFIQQQTDTMYKFYNHFGDFDLDKLTTKSDAVFFSYLDIMTVWYPVAVAFVFAGVIVGLLIAIILLNRKRKAFSWSKAGSGVLIQLLTIFATALSLFVVFYAVGLILSGFGVLTLQSISTVVFSNVGLLCSVMLLTLALSSMYYIIFKRTFVAKAPDVVRGNTLIWAFAGIVLAFAFPAASYLFTTVAILSLTVMLLTTIFKAKFKAKFQLDIERLFLNVWVIAIALPLFIPLFSLVGTSVSAIFLPITMCLFVGLLGFIAPYADYLKPVLDKLVKKLPPRTIKYEREVTEKIEDRAKKGKFTEVTSKKVVKEKIAWNYMNRVGIAIVVSVACVMIVLFSSFGANYSQAINGTPAYYDAIYDDSMLLVWEKSADETIKTSVEVHDQMAYKYISYAIKDMKWDNKKDAFVKNFSGNIASVIPTLPEIKKTDKTIDFSSFDLAYSTVKITINKAKDVKSVIFNNIDKKDSSKEEFVYENQDTIVFQRPYNDTNFSITVDASCEITFEQYNYNARNLQYSGSDWFELYEYYAGDSNISSALKSGIILRLSTTI